MNIKTVNNIEEFKLYYSLSNDGVIYEDDIDNIDSECDYFERKRRDAEVLTTIAANNDGPFLDIGTSHGRSAYKLATNIRNGLVFTVNALPEQIQQNEVFVTHLLHKDEIGSFYRKFNTRNVVQLYENTMNWELPEELNKISLVFVDGNHDTEAVYSDTKLAYRNLKEGGFILWHDFNPRLRNKYDWIDAAMRGIERFIDEFQIDSEIIHLNNSWIGVLKKPAQPYRNLATVSSPQVRQPTLPAPSMKHLRYLWVYPAHSATRISNEEGIVSRLRELGYDIASFGIPCKDGWWPFPTLDQKYRNHEPELVAIYEKLAERASDRNVLISSGGAMLHPDFIKSLPTYNVFICADDPESSEILSKPVAPSFDYCFVTNIACLDDYLSWGCRNVSWLFHAIRPGNYNPDLTEEEIAARLRDIDITLFCERVYGVSDRAQRIETLVREFPQTLVRGKGWPSGYVSNEEMFAYYERTKIGWNLHNSIGPTNTRLFTLPAFGVMQICDNKSNLNKIFQLDKEVVGFDTLQECIDKTRYYLAHDNERLEIAIKGWKRVRTDYTEHKQWEYLIQSISLDCLRKLKKDIPTPTIEPPVITTDGKNSTWTAPRRLPRLLLLVDRPGWAYDAAAQAIKHYLSGSFEIKIEYVVNQPDLNTWPFDLIHVFFWGETYHQKFVSDRNKVVKEVSSHRWANESTYGCLSAEKMVQTYLADAATVTCTSRRLEGLLSPHIDINFTPNGIEPDKFGFKGRRYGPLRIGWAGNANDPCKGLHDIIIPAAGDTFELVIAAGNLSYEEMQNFYNKIDVLCIASIAEGEPLTLLEGMAAGCFPVTVNVGIVPELVQHGNNGLIVERSIESFQTAFQWCAKNLSYIRTKAQSISRHILETRNWEAIIPHWERVFWKALQRSGWAAPSVAEQPAAYRPATQEMLKAPPSPAEPTGMAALKNNYFQHLQTMNPCNLERTYEASLFYYKAEILPNLPPDKGSNILDVGSGFGHLLRFILDSGYCSVGGVELDPQLYEVSKQYIGHRTKFLVHDDARSFLSNNKKTFDAIMALDVIEHFTLEEAMELAQLVCQALKPGGFALFRTPNMANVLGIYSRYLDLTHQTGFTEYSLQQLLLQSGFASTHLHLPAWDVSHPLTAKLAESRDFHIRLYSLQDRATPTCFEKNLVMIGRKGI